MKKLSNATYFLSLSLTCSTTWLVGCGDKVETCADATCGDTDEPIGEGGTNGDSADDETSSSMDNGEDDSTGGPGGKANEDTETSGDGDGDAPVHLPCDDGSWDEDEDPKTDCVTWTVCEPGEYVEAEGSADQDRSCSACPSGRFSDVENAEECVEHTECPSGVATEGDAASDTECLARARDVAVGGGFSCILREDETVSCWGANHMGQLGNGTTISSSLPSTVLIANEEDELVPLSKVIAIDAGHDYACALRDNGTVQCWGSNADGQLGTSLVDEGDFAVSAMKATGVEDVTSLALGYNMACAVLEDTSAVCWKGPGGIKGVPGPWDDEYAVVVDAALEPIFDIKSVVGAGHRCAITKAGGAYCWGVDYSGALGQSDGLPLANTPTPVSGLDNPVLVAVSGGRTCWLQVDGNVLCHGEGPFGSDLTGDIATPQIMSTNITGNGGPQPGVVDISLGEEDHCMLFDNGQVACWGQNSEGQLGDGSTEPSDNLVVVEGLEDIVAMDGGYGHACAIDEDGRVYCWGKNDAGQLGDGSITDTAEPLTVPGVDNAVEVSCGDHHTCALLDNHRMSCWGDNSSGQIGIGGEELQLGPTEILGITEVEQISLGGTFTMAIKEGEKLRGWGIGPATTSDTPADYLNAENATLVRAGGAHSCIWTSDGRFKCAGNNAFAQAGLNEFEGDEIAFYFELTTIADLDDFSLGRNHSCILLDGEVLCWGRNDFGQVGIFSKGMSITAPSLVPGLDGVTAIDLGSRFSLALLSNGQVKGWGDNSSGQLGRANTLSSDSPVLVAEPSSITHISAGEAHACAVVDDGSLKCWGNNSSGQLGIGSISEMSTEPVQVKGDQEFIQVSAGMDHTCAVTADHTVSCWGSNTSFQLGRTFEGARLEPHEVVWN